MTSPQTQARWRRKYRFVKTQLNVMARRQTHDALEQFARTATLRGKGEAVAFACFVTRALMQRAEYNADAAQMLDDFIQGYHRDRDLHSA
ncbi:MAG: hypothetical protein IPK66_10185 [Rhodospirillales bacterium]|nr:hypothetical protein [Rhodospirillales bacterium]